MEDADDFQGTWLDTVKDNQAFNRKNANTSTELGTLGTKFRIFGQSLDGLIQPIRHSVGCAHVVGCNMEPDIETIGKGAWKSPYLTRHSTLHALPECGDPPP